MDATRVARHILIGPDREAQMIALVRRELKDAAASGRPRARVARHSMGGQSLARDGTAFTFATPQCDIDTAARIYRAHAGTSWRDVIVALDPLGFAPAIIFRILVEIGEDRPNVCRFALRPDRQQIK